MMIFVGIGNSDNKLTQAAWSSFVIKVENIIRVNSTQIHGAWFSRPDAPWQNCCWCFEVDAAKSLPLRLMLAPVGRAYMQDSIAWSVAQTEFI